MKTSTLLLAGFLTAFGILVTPACASTPAAALPNPFGVFNLRPFNERPAQQQVDLAMQHGYDGLMASTWPQNPLERLREFLAVPAVRDGKFKIYAVLWSVHVDKPTDEAFLQELVAICKQLNAAVWCTVVGPHGERTVTLALLKHVAEQCQAGGAQLVLYPHHAWTFETAEESLEIWENLQHPEVKLSLHLSHEYKKSNQHRFDEIVTKLLPHLAFVSLNGIDTKMPILTKSWNGIIIPLNEGDFDARPFVTALARHGYRGPIFLNNFGFKSKPEEYLPASMKLWREISADVATQLAPQK